MLLIAQCLTYNRREHWGSGLSSVCGRRPVLIQLPSFQVKAVLRISYLANWKISSDFNSLNCQFQNFLRQLYYNYKRGQPYNSTAEKGDEDLQNVWGKAVEISRWRCGASWVNNSNIKKQTNKITGRTRKNIHLFAIWNAKTSPFVFYIFVLKH